MTEVEPQGGGGGGPGGQKFININRYATKKTIAQGMLDIALLTANASQLKYVLQAGDKHPFYGLMIGLISVSIILQVVSGLLALSVNALRDCRLEQPANASSAMILNYVQLGLALCITGITTGLTLLFLGSLNMNKPKNQSLADILNNVVTIKIFLISVVNVIISSFGIETAVQEDTKIAAKAQRVREVKANVMALTGRDDS